MKVYRSFLFFIFPFLRHLPLFPLSIWDSNPIPSGFEFIQRVGKEHPSISLLTSSNWTQLLGLQCCFYRVGVGGVSFYFHPSSELPIYITGCLSIFLPINFIGFQGKKNILSQVFHLVTWPCRMTMSAYNYNLLSMKKSQTLWVANLN